jgi:hypothetical protein
MLRHICFTVAAGMWPLCSAAFGACGLSGLLRLTPKRCFAWRLLSLVFAADLLRVLGIIMPLFCPHPGLAYCHGLHAWRIMQLYSFAAHLVVKGRTLRGAQALRCMRERFDLLKTPTAQDACIHCLECFFLDLV